MLSRPPNPLSQKQKVGSDRILAEVVETKMKWRARRDSNSRPSGS